VATVRLYVAWRDAILAIVDGHLEDALRLAGRFVERAEESGALVRGRYFGLHLLLAPALYLGRADAWLAAFDEYAGLAGITAGQLIAARAICLAQLGRMQEARTDVGPLLDDVETNSDENEPMHVLAIVLQTAVVFGERKAAQALAARLACVAHLAIGDWFYTSVARHLGDAAALAGDHTAARAYYAQALEAAGKIRFRPELALTHLRLAELLLEETDNVARLEALEHLDIAIPELRDMKMQPAFERALALRDTLAPAAAPGPARQSASDTLTAREREIASLVADGLSNHDIAERLVISEGTAEVHVKHILGKLGFRSRTQVAGWLARQFDQYRAREPVEGSESNVPRGRAQPP
jgi:ATP/maltotriose-dependent transcriptional regulator MalT